MNPTPIQLKTLFDGVVDNVSSAGSVPVTDSELKQIFEDIVESFKTVDPDKGRPTTVKY